VTILLTRVSQSSARLHWAWRLLHHHCYHQARRSRDPHRLCCCWQPTHDHRSCLRQHSRRSHGSPPRSHQQLIAQFCNQRETWKHQGSTKKCVDYGQGSCLNYIQSCMHRHSKEKILLQQTKRL